MDKIRIAIFSGLRNDITYDVILKLHIEKTPIEVVALFHEDRHNHKKLSKFIKKLDLKKIYRSLSVRVCNLLDEYIHKKPTLQNNYNELMKICSVQNIKIIKTNDINNTENIALINNLKIDLGVVIGTGIIKKKIYSLFQKGMINIHRGDIPKYRGGPPCFWELFQGEKHIGITVHKITKKLDAGGVLINEKIEINENDILETLNTSTVKRSSNALIKAIYMVMHDNYNFPQDITVDTPPNTMPFFHQILMLKFRKKMKYWLPF